MWKNKVVIITGSSLGIGKNLAEKFAKKGANVVLNARNEQRLQKVANEFLNKGFSISWCSGDVSNYNDCKKIAKHAFDKFGKIDVLINNAGLATMSGVSDMKPEVFKKIIDVNLNGAVFMTKAVLPHILKTKGSIMFIGSVAGIHGIPEYSAYSSSKMALTAIVESLRIELHNTGVHVGIVYVGFTENDPQKTFLNNDGNEVPLPSRSKIKQQPVDKVTSNIIRCIEKRTFKVTFTFLGRLNNILNRVFPQLVHLVLLRSYKKS